MDEQSNLTQAKSYIKFTEKEIRNNDDQYIFSLIGTKVHIERHIHMYGYICDTRWDEECQEIFCQILLFDDRNRYVGKSNYFLGGLEKLAPKNIKTKKMYVYKIWDEGYLRWWSGSKSRCIWTRKGDAVRHVNNKYYDGLRLVEFELLEVPPEKD